jgi:hypothetical protein
MAAILAFLAVAVAGLVDVDPQQRHIGTGRPAIAAVLVAAVAWATWKFAGKADAPRWQLLLAYAGGALAGLLVMGWLLLF